MNQHSDEHGQAGSCQSRTPMTFLIKSAFIGIFYDEPRCINIATGRSEEVLAITHIEGYINDDHA